MTNLTLEIIKRELEPYGITATPAACGQIKSYIDMLLLWNKKISLTTYLDPIEILRFHFGESVLALKFFPMTEGSLVDIGSGAGFPGLAIAMLSPRIRVSLIESNGKKAAFLSEVMRRLGMANVTILNQRLEDVISASPFDFVTVRAVAQTDDLFDWSRRNLIHGGKLVLWLGEDGVRRCLLTKHWDWAAPVASPGSSGRYMLAGSPAI